MPGAVGEQEDHRLRDILRRGQLAEGDAGLEGFRHTRDHPRRAVRILAIILAVVLIALVAVFIVGWMKLLELYFSNSTVIPSFSAVAVTGAEISGFLVRSRRSLVRTSNFARGIVSDSETGPESVSER